MTVHFFYCGRRDWMAVTTITCFLKACGGDPGQEVSGFSLSNLSALDTWWSLRVFWDPQRTVYLGWREWSLVQKATVVMIVSCFKPLLLLFQCFLLSSQQPLKYILCKFLFSFTVYYTMKGKPPTPMACVPWAPFITVKKQAFISVLSPQLYNSMTLGEASWVPLQQGLEVIILAQLSSSVHMPGFLGGILNSNLPRTTSAVSSLSIYFLHFSWFMFVPFILLTKRKNQSHVFSSSS